MTQNPKQAEALKKRREEIANLYPDLTLAEIGNRYNITSERVRQILSKVKQDKIK